LNSFHFVHDQPRYSQAEDPTEKLAVERARPTSASFTCRERAFCNGRRESGWYSGFVLAVFIASAGWLYSDAVKLTASSKQITAIRTLAVASSSDAVLSLTLGDGSHVQYVVKAPESRVTGVGKKVEQESLQKWQLASLNTALNIGGARLPLGIDLQMVR
jgi:hypothetical protein